MAERCSVKILALLTLLSFSLLIPALATAQTDPNVVTLKYPQAVSVAPDGKIFVSDATNHVYRLRKNGRILSDFMVPGGRPIIEVAPTGRTFVYAFGRGFGTLDIYSKHGKLLSNTTLDAENTHGYLDFAVGADGDLYCAYSYRGHDNEDRDRVRVFNKKGELLREWGSVGTGTEKGKFYYIQSIAVGPKGRVYVLDLKTIQVFTPDGRYLRRYKPWYILNKEIDVLPTAIAVNSKSNVLFSFNSVGPTSYVIEINRKRKVVNTWPIGGPDDNNRAYIFDIDVDADDNLYVINSNSNELLKFSPAGKLLRTFHKLKKSKKAQ